MCWKCINILDDVILLFVRPPYDVWMCNLVILAEGARVGTMNQTCSVTATVGGNTLLNADFYHVSNQPVFFWRNSLDLESEIQNLK